MDKDKRIALLESTLADTEKILFNPLFEIALKHFQKVRKESAYACGDLLNKRHRLKEARTKRPGKIT